MTEICNTGTKRKNPAHSVFLIIAGILIVGLITAVYLNTGYLADWIWKASGIEYGTITLLQTAMLVVNLITIPFCGMLTLRLSDFKLFCIGFVMSVAGLFGMFLFPSLPGLIIFYVLMFGFGSAISGYSIAMSVILPLIGEKFAGVASAGLLSCGNTVSLILFPILEANIVPIPGSWVFLVLGCIGLCLIPVLFYIFRRRKVLGITATGGEKKETVKLRSLAKEVFSNPKFYLICFLSFTFGAIATSPSGNLMHELEVYFNTDSVTNALYLSAFSITFVIAGIICGIFLIRIQSKMMYAGICFLAVAVLHLLDIIGISFETAVLSIFGTAFLMGAISPVCAILIREMIGSVKFAAVYSPVYLLLRLGGIVSIFIGGMEYALFYDFEVLLFMNEILPIAAGILATIVGIREIRKRKSSTKK